MYAFPRFELPPKAIEAAKDAGQAADVFYAFQLLEETGKPIEPIPIYLFSPFLIEMFRLQAFASLLAVALDKSPAHIISVQQFYRNLINSRLC